VVEVVAMETVLVEEEVEVLEKVNAHLILIQLVH
jgi:hypothetical protein